MANTSEPWTNRGRWLIGVGYVLCWVVGLLIGGPTIEPVATSAEIEGVFAGSFAVLVFAILVHGVAAAFLVGLGLTLSSGRWSRLAVALACIAAALSLVQLAGEVAMVFTLDGIDAAAAWEGITRVDGVKMFVLAGLVAAVEAGRTIRRPPLTVMSVVTALSLLFSGAGYLTVTPALVGAAMVSLPLLLIWALTATAVRVSEARRERRQAF